MHPGNYGRSASSLLSSPANDMGGSYRKRAGDFDGADTRRESSRVVFVSDLRSNTCELEVRRAFQIYGKINVILMIPYKRQALIEFAHFNDARELVSAAKSGEWPSVGDKNVLVDFSKHAHVDIAVEPYMTREPTNILIFAIFNSRVNFKSDAILKICEPFGFIETCIITRQDDGITKAVVEFDKMEEAVLAKPHLNGADMFPNCNSIRIDYAKRTCFDYLLANEQVLDEYRSGQDNYRPMMKRSRASDSNGMNFSSGGGYNDFPGGGSGGAGGYSAMSMPHHQGGSGMLHQGPPGNLPNKSILIIKGLSKEMNCDRLFNILCLYGNVKTIKFVTNRDGLALAEMMDPMSAQQVLDFMNNADLLGGTIRINLSDQDKVKENTQDLRLPDGTVALKHYESLRLNRFMTPKQAAKNKPKRDISGLVLYFWGCPDGSDENAVRKVLSDNGVDCPCKVTLQNPEGTSGWITFESTRDATNAICIVNHAIVSGDTKIKFNYAVSEGIMRPK